MNRIIIVLGLILFGLSSQAQTLTGGEYFFDTAPELGSGTQFSFAPADTINQTLNVSVTSLSSGFHYMFVRVKNAIGIWSHYEGRLFYIISPAATNQPSLVAGEWFVDTDPGLGNGTAIAFSQNDTVNHVVNIDVSVLSPGFHNMFVRVKNAIGIWSHYEGRLFYVMPAIVNQSHPMLVSGEWFVDTDPGLGNGTAISFDASDTVHVIANISYEGLSVGMHNLFIRAKNEAGIWSHYEGRQFIVQECYTSIATTPAENSTMCQGDSLILTSSAGVSYLWNNGATTQNIIVKNTGDYFVSIDNGCGGILTSAIIHVTANPLPVPVITGSTTTLTGESEVYTTEAGMSGYVWALSPGGIITGGLTTNTVTVNWISGGTQTISVSYANENGCLPTAPTVMPVEVSMNRNLEMTVLLQGLYNGDGLMRKAQNADGDQFAGTTADQVIIELHSAISGEYTTIVYSTGLLDISRNGEIVVDIPAIYNGAYYLTIKHHNSIETVSAVPVSFTGGTISYSFDTPTKVYGGNLLLMPDGHPVIYAGDVNHDGIVNAEDINQVYNDCYLFSTGYLDTDINGDGIIDALDLIMVDNNAVKFISVMKP